jgi:hypothetical protein
MKAKLYYASDWRREETLLEINSLEDLLKLQLEMGNELVIRTEFEINENAESLSELLASKTTYLHITVYDSYLE